MQAQTQRSHSFVLSMALVLGIGGLADCCFAQQRSSEHKERLREALRQCPQADANRDGVLTLSEAQAFLQQQKKQEHRALHVVLLADEKDHGPAGNGLHDYPLWQKRWALLLGGEEASEEKQVNLVGPPDKGADYREGMPHVEVTTAQNWPSEEQFQTADVIVAYCYLQWTDGRLAQIRRYLENGGGLVLIHSATWTKPKPSRDVAEVIGVGGFELFRHGTIRLDLVAPEHPICVGLPETVMLANDETYWPPTPIMEGVTVLATSVEDKAARGSTPRAAQPLFWCYELGKGRVFGCVPGHSAQTFDDPVFRKLLLRGMAWAAGDNPARFDGVLPLIWAACASARAIEPKPYTIGIAPSHVTQSTAPLVSELGIR